jgi:hypothetical protein
MVCEWTDSLTMDCLDVFWRLSDCKNVSSCGRLPQEVLLEEFYRS